MSWFLFILTVAAVTLGLLGAPRVASADTLVINNFNTSGESWKIYDYNGLPFPQMGGNNVFYDVTWESSGGVGNSGYVWADASRWRIDVPEDPDSILSLIYYNRWVTPQSEYRDLRQTNVSVYLRGDNLDLKGASVQFWACNSHRGSRWHYTSQPLSVSQGTWGQKLSFVLSNNENLWHNSWGGYPENPASLNEVLSTTDSFGFSFLGFPTGQEVTGTFSMDSLVITTVPEPTSAEMLAIGGLVLLAAVWWHIASFATRNVVGTLAETVRERFRKSCFCENS